MSGYEISGAEHRLVEANGITISVYLAEPLGEPVPAPPVLLLHGFPELAFSWRHQIPVLSAAGFTVIAPDQRGYGLTSRPDAITDYDIHHLSADLVGLLDALGHESAIVVGHDWGGLIAWQMPLLHRERVAAVVGVNTPYLERLPAPPTEVFRSVFGDDHYIVAFQEPEVADRFLAENLDAVLPALARTGVPPEELANYPSPLHIRPGAGEPALPSLESLPGAPLMSDNEMSVYRDTFRETGFTGGINWYRNMDRNWESTPEQEGARIDGIPCLMITAEWDPFLPPALASGMGKVIGELETVMIAGCGHWTQQEKPSELNAILTMWLSRKFGHATDRQSPR